MQWTLDVSFASGSSLLVAEHGRKIAPGVHDAKDQDVPGPDAIYDQVAADRKAAPASPQVVVAGSPQVGMTRQQVKSTGD
jgi:hypothetical protein